MTASTAPLRSDATRTIPAIPANPLPPGWRPYPAWAQPARNGRAVHRAGDATTLVSMQCFARTQRRMLHAADPDPRANVTLARMVGLTYTANALNMTLPAGSAVSVAYTVKWLREWGSTNAAAVFTVVASGALSSATFFHSPWPPGRPQRRTPRPICS